MIRFLTIIVLSVLFIVPETSAQSDSTESTKKSRTDRFWDDFEQGINQLVDKITRTFDEPSGNVDSTEGERQFIAADELSSMSAHSGLLSRRRYGLPDDRYRIQWVDENLAPDVFNFHYNRVEGFFFGVGSEKKFYWEEGKLFAPSGSIGYGFASHTWRGSIGVSRQFVLAEVNNNELIEVGVEAYSLTDTKDQWLIKKSENTLAALLIREDFRNYFERNGVTVHTSYYAQTSDHFFEGRIGFAVDRYASLGEGTGWSVFGGKKRFRSNPAIDDGRMNTLQLLAGLTTTRARYGRPHGWSVQLSGDIADANALGGSFSFSRYLADVRRYQPLSKYDQVNVRLRIGTSLGALPRQMSFELGGLGTLPAYGFKSLHDANLEANRMILINGEYIVNGDFLGDLDFWPSFVMRHINLLFLADVGWVGSVAADASPLSGFEGINGLRSDLGVGLTNRSGSWRLAYVWRTDTSESGKIYFRVSMPF